MKKKKHISGSEAFLKKQKQKQKNKPDRLKIGLIVFTFVLSAVFAVASGLFMKDHIHRKNHCTAEIVGEVTNVSTWRTGSRRHHYHGKADVVVKSDGVFPSQTIHTTSYYIAKQKSVKIFYDPENTKEYYFESNIEVDFYLPEQNLAIQVSYSILDEATTRERELNALERLRNYLPDANCVLITNSEEAEIEYHGIRIDVIPVWKWLLKKE